jgi:flagellar protein FlaG
MSTSTSIQPGAPTAPRPVSPLGRNEKPVTGELPATTTFDTQGKQPVPRTAVAPDPMALAAELERIVPPSASLRFRVDPELHRVVVSVVDAETGDILRQIPSEEAIAIAQSLVDSGSGIVRDVA